MNTTDTGAVRAPSAYKQFLDAEITRLQALHGDNQDAYADDVYELLQDVAWVTGGFIGFGEGDRHAMVDRLAAIMHEGADSAARFAAAFAASSAAH